LPAPSATITPTLPVPTPTITPTATLPAPSPTPAVIDPEALDALELQLVYSPYGATPGGRLDLGWRLDGLAAKMPGLQVRLLPAAGLTTERGLLDALTKEVVFEVEEPEDWQAWQIPTDLAGPYLFQATLIYNGRILKARSLLIDEYGLTRLPKEGGAALGFEKRIQVDFPAGALSEAVDVRIRPPIPANQPPYYLSNKPFEVIASGLESGLEVHQFTQPITITVPYTGTKEASVFYYETKQQTWLPLTTFYDRKAGLLIAQSDHLSLLDTDVNEWQMAEMPTVSEAQVAEQTGAATYSYPLWTPPGPGGLHPALALSYNSQVIDSSIGSLNQGGWAGMGWSLDTGYVERDLHGTLDGASDDTFNLVLNGVSSRILRDANNGYHLANENFWKITAAGDTWTIWDKAGNKYVFGKDANTWARYPQYYWPGCSQPNDLIVWRWVLAEVENKFGKKLTYTYTKDSKLIDDPCNTGTDPADIAIYPATISYPNGRYRVRFELEGRSDYKSEWWSNDDYRVFFHRYRLNVVHIEHYTGSAWQLARKYDLSYSGLFPGLNWSAGGVTFTVSNILEYGSDGTSTRPATSFSYGDVMHLGSVNNGYNASVAFGYESTPWADLSTFEDYNSTLLSSNCPGGWTGAISCVGNPSPPKLYANGTAYYDFKNVHPGGVYEIYFELANIYGGSARLGTVKLQYGNDSVNDVITVINQNVPAYTNVSASMRVTLDRYSSKLKWVVYGGGGGLRIVNAVLKLMPTRYRVSARTVTDTRPGAPPAAVYSYEYDGAATNDAEHSLAVKNETPGVDDLYVDAYAQYRGNALSREIGPLGTDGKQRVTTTWYHQDDQQKGLSSVSMVGVRSYAEQFTSTSWATYDPAWDYNTSAPAFERLSGDVAAKITNSSANWNVGLYRASLSLEEKKMALVHFRLDDNTVQSILAIASGTIGTDYYRWGLKRNGGNLVMHRCTTSDTNCTDGELLLNGITEDTWYVLQLALEDNDPAGNVRLLLQVWNQEEPQNMKVFEEVVGGKNNKQWRFLQKSYAGTVWLDEYSEGNTYTLSATEYDTDPVEGLTKHTNIAVYDDLAFEWTRPIAQTAMTFEGDASWAGTRTTYDYVKTDQGGTQYGNLTHVKEFSWNGSSWQAYRASYTGYYPNPGGAYYPVAYPAFTNRYVCTEPVNCTTNTMTGQQLYLYDGNTNYAASPSVGKLTGERTLLRLHNNNPGDPRYADARYSYDNWGNRITSTVYTGEGDASGNPPSGAQVTTTCFGENTVPTGCANDNYYTYPLWSKNALNQQTSWAYSGQSNRGYLFGQPTGQTDPNNAASTLEYDVFGRLSAVRRPGDESGTATLQIAYFDSQTPFYTEASQKISGTTTFTVRKYYNGLGQLLQTRQRSAVVNGASRDVQVDYFYDLYGQLKQQSTPHDVATTAAFAQLTSDLTTTVHDVLGRVVSVQSPDGAYPQRNSYLDLETQTTDARNYTTRSLLDVWGRTVEVRPPLDPRTKYFYDASDSLYQVEQWGSGSLQSTTTLAYDMAGRKLSMNDPDMGAWYYSYDALGSLLGQVDANKQGLSLGYDGLGRLVSKVVVDTTKDTFDAKDTTNWVWNAQQTVPYNDGGNNVARNDGTGLNWDATFYRSSYSLAHGKALQVRFKTDNVNANMVTSVEANDTTYRRFGLYTVSGRIQAQVMLQAGVASYTDLMALEANTWYSMQIVLDDQNGFSLLVFKESDPSQRGVYRYAMPTGKTWRFHHWLWTDCFTYLDDYNEFDAIRYGYDGGANGIGRRTSMTDPSGSTSWTYDARGRLTQESKVISGSGTFLTQWAYNAADQVTSMTYPGGNAGQAGEVVSYAYHLQGALNTLTGGNSYVTGTSYDAAGRALLRSLGNSRNTQYTYYAWSSQGGRLQTLKTGTGNPVTPTLQSLAYSYDAIGNPSSIVDYLAGGTQTLSFSYDALNRLSTAQAVGGTEGPYALETYGYDAANGNLTSKAGVGIGYNTQAAGCPHGALSKEHAATSAGMNSYCYDPNGNMTRRTIGGVNYSMTYNAENRMTGMTGTGVSASFVYDGDGARVQGVVGGATVAYVGAHYEWTSAGNTRYYYAGLVRVAMQRASYAADNGVFYLLGDHLGSTSVIANSSGGQHSEQMYKPWGEKRYPTGASALLTTYRFTGQRQESGLGPSGGEGLYYYGARWFDPYLGRFVQADTIVPGGDPKSWDRYAYVLNNPLRWVDPTGHVCSDPEDPTPTCENGGRPSTGRSGGGSTGGGGSSGNPNRRRGGLPITPPIKGRELLQYEINLLTIAIYAESSNFAWPDLEAIEMLGWVYLNRLTLWRDKTLLDAIQGSNCAACVEIGNTPQLSDEKWVANTIEYALLEGDYSESWLKAQKMANSVATKWKFYGTGSSVDPTYGSTNLYVAKSPSEWNVTFEKYASISEDYSMFRWAASDFFAWGGIMRVLITRTEYPPGFE
jgi:RHS repeat-associated protein